MNLTVVMITHQMEVVRDACSRVAVISEGKVVEEGNVKDIFLNPKNDVTREFISNIDTRNDEDNSIIRWSNEGGEYELGFPPDLQGAPVMSQLSKLYDVEFNIRAAGVQKLTDNSIGKMIVDLIGSEEEVAKAVNYLRERGLVVNKLA
jgi:D-methionine transport system ATP-binding protein